jgi:hypothetical protein
LFGLLTDDTIEPSQSQECFLINELIREYLQFNGYSNSLSVFVRDPINHNFLAHMLNIQQPHRLIPLLYTLTAAKDELGPINDPPPPARDAPERE